MSHLTHTESRANKGRESGSHLTHTESRTNKGRESGPHLLHTESRANKGRESGSHLLHTIYYTHLRYLFRTKLLYLNMISINLDYSINKRYIN